MRPNRHRIQRQVIELAVSDSQQGRILQHAIARSFWDRTVPDLEAVFDRAAGPDERLRVDRLEIDLGTIAGADWEPQFRRKLVEELARALARFTTSNATARQDERAEPPVLASESWETFLFFLVQGRLPWWCAQPPDDWSGALLKSSTPLEWSALRRTILGDARSSARLVVSASDAFLDAAIVNWSGPPHAAQVLSQVTPSDLPAAVHTRWRRRYWQTVLDAIVSRPFHKDEGPGLLRRLRAARQTFVATLDPRQATTTSIEPVEPTRAFRGDELLAPWRAWSIAEADATVVDRAARETRDEDEIVEPPRAPSTRNASAPQRAIEHATDDDAVYVHGAGVILVHPFLEALFRDRGLLTDRRAFRDPEARLRAVQLVGLLAFGRAETPEYELLTAKLLCGVPFEDPLEQEPLPEDDHRACDEVLRAVLGHWTALRSTSPQWLREQFFLRGGKLERVDEGYRLTLERRAQDVLLARLPWGCGVIGLPWLDDRIFVRWLE